MVLECKVYYKQMIDNRQDNEIILKEIQTDSKKGKKKEEKARKEM